MEGFLLAKQKVLQMYADMIFGNGEKFWNSEPTAVQKQDSRIVDD